MALIVPYEKSLSESRGCFIKPSGEMLLIDNGHEEFAKKYLSNKKLFTEDELYLYNEWIKNNDSLSDFLFFVLNYDKVEVSWRKVITTTDINPHIRFYNYYLMDWNIYIERKMYYDLEYHDFKFIDDQNYLFNYQDRNMEEEIEDIKKKVLKKDRKLFFK